MGGVGVSWFESELDYTDRRGDESVEGEHRSRMTSVQPYVGWTPRPGTRAWASVGYGRGEVEVRDEAERERFGSQRSDSRLLGAALGGAVRWETERALRVDFKGEAQATRYELRGNDSLLEGLSVRTRRLRLSAEGSREYALSGGGRLAPSGELGVRWDGGDGATGAGMEVGAGVSWSAADGRLSLEARGRTLAAHRSGLDEWGLSGGLRVAPRPNGRGLSLSVQPTWGASGSARSRLWEEGMAGRGSPSGGGAGVDAELGWGAGAFRGFGSATPYLRYGQAQEGERRYGLGVAARPSGGRVRAGPRKLAPGTRPGPPRARPEPRPPPALVDRRSGPGLGTASWERLCPARIDRRRPRHPICGRDTSVPRTPASVGRAVPRKNGVHRRRP